MIAALILATLTAAPGAVPTAALKAAHAPDEAALLRAAYPDHDQESGFLGHAEGVLIERSSACVENGPCLLAVAASDGRPGSATASGHAWTTFFAFRMVDGAWAEQGRAAGPVLNATGKWLIGVYVMVDQDGPFVTVTSSTSGGEEGDGTATHLWSWDGAKFLPVLTAANTKLAASETEASFALCVDRPGDRPSWELRTREREAKGKWTDGRVRVEWGGQAWVERPADHACSERGERSSAVAAVAAAAEASTLRLKSASASKTAAAPKKKPKATSAANAIDGNPQTAWTAGGRKNGIGEWLQVALATPAAIGSIQLLGTCPFGDWKAGPRIKRIRLRFEDGPAQDERLPDVQAAQSIVVNRKTPARWIRIELVELYRGTKWHDGCISEVTLQGR